MITVPSSSSCSSAATLVSVVGPGWESSSCSSAATLVSVVGPGWESSSLSQQQQQDARKQQQQQPRPLKLKQYVATRFRRESGVLENGRGVFSTVRVAAHHACVSGAVRVNGRAVGTPSTVLHPGDAVSMRVTIDPADADYRIWVGAAEVARKEGILVRSGDAVRRMGGTIPRDDEEESPAVGSGKNTTTTTAADCAFVRYYRLRFPDFRWDPDVFTAALPLSVRIHTSQHHHDVQKARSVLLANGFEAVDTPAEVGLLYDCSESAMFPLATSSNDPHHRTAMVHRNPGSRSSVLVSKLKHRGFVSQQELVSMLPPMVLLSEIEKAAIAADVSSDRDATRQRVRVLDTCSAPGSKTVQMLDGLATVFPSSSSLSSYLLVANDADPERADQVVLRARRLGPAVAQHLVVCSEDAATLFADHVEKFHFVLCDVPCSGDGTVKKSPRKLERWTEAPALSNRALQQRILRRGLALLARGGTLVYSTCSLNPVENEDVVRSVLSEVKDYHLARRYRRHSDIGVRVFPGKTHGGFFFAVIRREGTLDFRCKEDTRGLSGIGDDNDVEDEEDWDRITGGPSHLSKARLRRRDGHLCACGEGVAAFLQDRGPLPKLFRAGVPIMYPLSPAALEELVPDHGTDSSVLVFCPEAATWLGPILRETRDPRLIEMSELCRTGRRPFEYALLEKQEEENIIGTTRKTGAAIVRIEEEENDDNNASYLPALVLDNTRVIVLAP